MINFKQRLKRCERLKRAIRRSSYFIKSPSLYRLSYWIKWFFHQERGVIARPGKDLCIEGYPSSANTFFNILVQVLNPGIVTTHHTHSLANVKLAFKYNIPTIIIIRNPLDCIASRLARSKRFEGDIKVFTKDYIDFYSPLLNKDQPLFLSFETITQCTSKAIEKISGELGINFQHRYNQEVEDDVFTYMRISYMVQGEYKPSGTTPSQKRERKKEQVKPEIRSQPPFPEAKNLFEEADSF